MKRTQMMFYATAQDLTAVLSSLEAKKRLQYTLAGLFKENASQTFATYAKIPDFGRAHHPTAVANPRYLVADQGTIVCVREVPQSVGGVRFAIDQRENPNTVAFSPGGTYGKNVILYGMIGTVSEADASKNLYNFLAKPFREHFEKIREYFVGPEAADLWRAGARLTIGALTPQEFDLRR